LHRPPPPPPISFLVKWGWFSLLAFPLSVFRSEEESEVVFSLHDYREVPDLPARLPVHPNAPFRSWCTLEVFPMHLRSVFFTFFHVPLVSSSRILERPSFHLKEVQYSRSSRYRLCCWTNRALLFPLPALVFLRPSHFFPSLPPFSPPFFYETIVCQGKKSIRRSPVLIAPLSLRPFLYSDASHTSHRREDDLWRIGQFGFRSAWLLLQCRLPSSLFSSQSRDRLFLTVISLPYFLLSFISVAPWGLTSFKTVCQCSSRCLPSPLAEVDGIATVDFFWHELSSPRRCRQGVLMFSLSHPRPRLVTRSAVASFSRPFFPSLYWSIKFLSMALLHLLSLCDTI